MQTRRHFMIATGAVLAQSLAPAVRAQTWPQRPVKVIVAFAPGGNSDLIARIVCQRLSNAFGQNFFVENRGGSGGAIGAEAAARAAPDGYTLFMAVSSPMAVTPALQKVRYDPIKDFAPISNVGSSPLVLTVNSNFPARTLGEFVAYVRARPGKVTFGSGGIGTISHLAMMLFAKRADLNLVHVPYRGGGPVIMALMGGQIDSTFANLSEALNQAQSGSLRMLAISTAARDPQAPDVPTVSESGYPGFNVDSWNGLVAPAGTPKEIIDQIAAEIVRAAKDPKFVEQLSRAGFTAIGNSPAEFATTIRSDVALWAQAVKIGELQERSAQ